MVASLMLFLLGDIRTTVKDTREDQIDNVERIVKLEANYINLKANAINTDNRVGRIEDAIFHSQ